MSSQKGEFIFLGSAQHNYIVCLIALVLEESILLVTLVHVLSLTMNIYDKSKQNKHSLKFENYRQTFEGYKMTFVYALIYIYTMYVYIYILRRMIKN